MPKHRPSQLQDCDHILKCADFNIGVTGWRLHNAAGVVMIIESKLLPLPNGRLTLNFPEAKISDLAKIILSASAKASKETL